MSEKIGSITATEGEDGKAVFEFDGKIKSTDELLTTAQDVIGAINELFLLEPKGGGFNGNFRAFIDPGGTLTVVVGKFTEAETAEESTTKGSTAETETYTDYVYSYGFTSLEVDEISYTTARGKIYFEKFYKRIVTNVSDPESILIMETDYNTDTGYINGYIDGNDISIYTAEWRVTDE